MVLAFPTRASALFTLSFLASRHLMTDRATHRRAGQGVMVGEMTGDPANHRDAEAASLGLAGDEGGGDRAEQDFRTHGWTFLHFYPEPVIAFGASIDKPMSDKAPCGGERVQITPPS
jgi:hypothetical protein